MLWDLECTYSRSGSTEFERSRVGTGSQLSGSLWFTGSIKLIIPVDIQDGIAR